MVSITLYYVIGTVGMALGTLAFARAFLTDPRNRTYHALLVGIAGIATLAYVCMTFGIGEVQAANGGTVELARYVQWVFATPLIVVYLGLLAGINRQYIAALVVVDVLVMLSGLAAAFFTGPTKWALFGVGSVLFVGLIYGLTARIRESVSARPTAVVALFEKLRNLTLIIWTFYPVLWVLGPTGIAVLDLKMEVLLITYADVIAKVLFGFIALNSQTSLARLPELDALSLGGSSGRTAPTDTEP